jgi:hypothetical protein
VPSNELLSSVGLSLHDARCHWVRAAALAAWFNA